MSIGLIFLLTILPHLAFAGARVTLSLFALHLGATPLTVGMIISLIAVVPMVFSVRWGRRIDRIGVYKPMLLGSSLVLAALLLAFALPRIETLFAVSVLAGSGFMMYHICVNQAAALVGRPEDRTRNFSVLALAFSTSGFIGPVTAGFAIDGIGHRNTFLLCAFFMIATLVLIRHRKSAISRLHKPFAHEAAEKRASDLLRIPAMLRIFIISGLMSMCWDLYSFVMPIHGSSIGLSASTIGLILGSFGCAIFLFRLILPWIVHRFDERTLLIAAMVITGLMLALIPLVHSVPLLMAVSFVLGIGLGGTQPMIMAMLYEKAPPGRGAEAVGMRTLLLNITQAVIPMIFGALGAALGMTPVFFAMAAAVLWGAWYARREA
ncbi:MAG TPA: MFS transporter [Burkholderiales bacterium]|nr:MFS transporter [Burkholderiales bacterium]